jgi:hypothetical protein
MSGLGGVYVEPSVDKPPREAAALVMVMRLCLSAALVRRAGEAAALREPPVADTVG